MSTTLTRSARGLIAMAAAAALMLVAMSVEARAASTVTIRGNAYAFIFAGNVSRLEGATIGIAEIPGLSTTAGPNGAYALEVPDDRTITPYAEFDGYYPTHVQTFHTSGQDLTQVNFQMPAMTTYNLLAGFVEAGQEPDDSLSQCGIVSTFFQKEGRSFTDFDDFHDFRPHGVIGSTALATPTAGRQLYFNESVLPDPDQESSSRDGGVLWVDVESGVYEIKGYSDTTRHSSFIATCEPGRLVNANPPWGLVELAGNEAVNPAVLPDTELHARIVSSVVRRKNARKRTLRLRIKATEAATAYVQVRQGKRKLKRRVRIKPGSRLLKVALPARFRRGRASLKVVLSDGAGNSETTTSSLAVPAPKR
jgi:hypothetical protein